MSVKHVETAGGTVRVELDAPSGKIEYVGCPEHGRMAESIEQQAYICKECGRKISRQELEGLRQQGFDEVRRNDRERERLEAMTSGQRLAERQQERREEKA